MSLERQPAIPILRIFDIPKAREFYLDFRGFTVDWEHQFAPDLPVYMQVHRSGLRLHLSEHFGDACPGSTVYVEAAGLAAWQKELIGKQYRNLRPGLESTPWNSLCLEVIDPFGNRLRFDEKVAADTLASA